MTMICVHVAFSLVLVILAIVASAQCQGASMDAIPKDERERLCNETKAACADACHHESASCDTQTLVWGCHCPPNPAEKMIGSKPIGTFPIPRKMCRIDLALCQSSCQHLGEHGNQAKICRLQCAGSFPCDSINAPVYNGTSAMASSSRHNHHDERTKDQEQQHRSSLAAAATTTTMTRNAQALVLAIVLGCCMFVL